MQKFLLFFYAIAIIFLTGCDSESDPVNSDQQTYNVEYKVTPASAEINEIKYLNAAGDTLTVSSIISAWSYTWGSKGKPGDYTFIKVTLENTAGKAYFQILANNSVLVSDSVEGLPGGTTSLSRGISLP